MKTVGRSQVMRSPTVNLIDARNTKKTGNHNMLFVVVGTQNQHTTYWTKAVPNVAVYVNLPKWSMLLDDIVFAEDPLHILMSRVRPNLYAVLYARSPQWSMSLHLDVFVGRHNHHAMSRVKQNLYAVLYAGRRPWSMSLHLCVFVESTNRVSMNRMRQNLYAVLYVSR